LGAVFGLVAAGGGVTLGVSVSFLQAKKKADKDRINRNFFIRLKCFSINLIKLLLIERK
jgi:hypothetical protein